MQFKDLVNKGKDVIRSCSPDELKIIINTEGQPNAECALHAPHS